METKDLIGKDCTYSVKRFGYTMTGSGTITAVIDTAKGAFLIVTESTGKETKVRPAQVTLA